MPYALEGGTVVTATSDDGERPVRIVSIHRGVITVENAGVHHRVALDREDEVGVRGELVGHGEVVLDTVLCHHRGAGRDLADEWQHRRLPGRASSTTAARRERPPSMTSSARGLVASRRISPARSSFSRCAWTVDGDVSPTACPISRTVGG